MSSDQGRFRAAIARIDAAHAEDPSREVVDGREVPRELLYAERMTRWLERLAPEASEALRLAVRAQHLRRWSIPRDRYPMDRHGYLRWRTELAREHAESTGEILRAVGYDEETIRRVQALLRKQGLRTNEETQILEDAACLVFLEHDFAAFARKQEEAKLIEILRKTWLKMSPRAHTAALALPLAPEHRSLVERALDEAKAG
jgi:hypothetical protein